MAFEFQVLDQSFQKALSGLSRDIDDLRIPFGLMINEWFKSNRAIFASKGPGKYTDLKSSYKKQKQKRWGFVYPILRASGALEDSITKKGDENSIAMVVNKKSMVVGSKVPYGKFHQFGTSNLPVRPWILIGPEQVSPPDVNRRLTAWINIMNDFVDQRIRQEGLK